VPGSFLVAMKSATFNGILPEAPFTVKCVIDLSVTPVAPPNTLKFAFPLKQWHGQPILHLAYFSQVAGILRQTAQGNELQAELFVRGNSVFRGQITGSSDGALKQLAQVIAWIDRCRAVANKYGINPCVPELSKVTNEDWDVIDDLFALLTTNRITAPYPQLSAKVIFRGPQRSTEYPSFGCLRFDTENARFQVLGTPIQAGRLRWILTNVNFEPLAADADGQRWLRLKGTESTLRILEKF